MCCLNFSAISINHKAISWPCVSNKNRKEDPLCSSFILSLFLPSPSTASLHSLEMHPVTSNQTENLHPCSADFLGHYSALCPMIPS